MSESIEQDLQKLVNICHSNLRNSKECLRYLKTRGMTKDLIKKNKIGYFPQNIGILKKYISEELLLKLNIARISNGSDFSEYFYLIFPIFSEYNDVVGISGRSLLSESDRKILSIPKYKNSSYKKSDVLYGLNNSKESILREQNAYIVEGYFDYLSMANAGIKNCVAICGTAFSKKHFLKLARYTNKLTFLLDSDTAGKASSDRIYSKFINKGIKLRFLSLPESFKDVDEFLTKNKGDAKSSFQELSEYLPEVWQ
jgi:DNA primase